MKLAHDHHTRAVRAICKGQGDARYLLKKGTKSAVVGERQRHHNHIAIRHLLQAIVVLISSVTWYWLPAIPSMLMIAESALVGTTPSVRAPGLFQLPLRAWIQVRAAAWTEGRSAKVARQDSHECENASSETVYETAPPQYSKLLRR